MARTRKKSIPLEHRLVRPVEVSLYGLAISGLVVFSPLHASWQLARWALVVHIAVAATAVPCVIVPFWIIHRRRLKASRRGFHIWSGRSIESILLTLGASGIWLLCIGQNGTALGMGVHTIHMIAALPLVILVIVHAFRFSLVRLLFYNALLMGILASRMASAFADGSGHAVESRSLLLEPDGKTLLSANFDGGSVSRIDRVSGKLIKEQLVGGNIVALGVSLNDALVAATDFSGGRVFFLDLDSLEIERCVSVGGRPAGVVYDDFNHLFWVANAEDDTLYGIAPDGTVKLSEKTGPSPRGLALMPDGRLLVSHALIGAVSIYDTRGPSLERMRLIRLAVSQNPDEEVSQGLPRRLDRIAVSPDGREAWIPHVLWNFDHPFQFQSTVFPAISVLSLAPGHEHEAVSRRKQLFRQINIIEDGVRTRIVSDPADVAFSNDGGKAYVTMAGSEDLVVFDLSRALDIGSENPKARTTAGAKAIQIYRHLPGDNPRALIVDGEDIYVQNAMSLDLSRLKTGGSGPFAQVEIVAGRFASLVERDPMASALRRGERLFNLANTSAFPGAPVAGDNWMSCSSCHIDGFNFTNRALFEAASMKPSQSAITGHPGIKKFVAGDFIGDYIRMIKTTQGGMGADTRFPAPDIDPGSPPDAVKKMMEDLHAYVISPNNLPLLATWLRGENGGDTIEARDWINSATCASCHEDIFREWSNSTHRFMSRSDPYYVVLEDLAAKTEGEPFRAWCMGCHAPQVLLSGGTQAKRSSNMLDRGGASLFAELENRAHRIDEGTGCLFCHQVHKIENAGRMSAANASIDISLARRPLYPGEESDFRVARGFAHRMIRALPREHVASFGKNLADGSSLCAACHEEFAPGTGAYIVSTYQQWKRSSFNAPENPQNNRTCVDCHMKEKVPGIAMNPPGRATDGGPIKSNVAVHRFSGAQYHLVGLRDPAASRRAIEMLRSAATLAVVPSERGHITIRVTNIGVGHNLPGGVSDFRQMWLDVTVTDSHGKIVLSSGKLDSRGNLDPDARIFHKVLNDTNAHKVGLKFWKIGKIGLDTTIPADGYRDETFILTQDPAYPLTLDVALEFRTFPQWVTDHVRARFPEMPNPRVVTMERLFMTMAGP